MHARRHASVVAGAAGRRAATVRADQCPAFIPRRGPVDVTGPIEAAAAGVRACLAKRERAAQGRARL
jgi:hypothetical protein